MVGAIDMPTNQTTKKQKDNVIQMPLRLGGPDAPRVDISILQMIGSTFDSDASAHQDISQNIFAS